MDEFLLWFLDIFKMSEKGWRSKRKCESTAHICLHDLDYLPSLATLEFNSDLDFEKLDKSPFALTKPSRWDVEEKNLG